MSIHGAVQRLQPGMKGVPTHAAARSPSLIRTSSTNMSDKANRPKIIEQNILDFNSPPISVYKVIEKDVEGLEVALATVLGQDSDPKSFGISGAYSSGKHRSLLILAIALGSNVLLVELQQKPNTAARKLLYDYILCNEDAVTLAFDLGPLALALYHDRGIKINNGLDIQSCCEDKVEDGRKPEVAIEFLFGASTDYIANKSNIVRTFDQRSLTWDPSPNSSSLSYVAQRAWVASLVSTVPDLQSKLEDVPRVKMLNFTDEHLKIIAQQVYSSDRLAFHKPVGTKHDFTQLNNRGKKANIQMDRFQNRILRKDQTTRVTIRDDETGAVFEVHGRSADKNGRFASLRVAANLDGRTIIALHNDARDDLTRSEQCKYSTLLRQLQGLEKIFDNPFIQAIWPGNTDVIWPDRFITIPTVPPILTKLPLNESQQEAINHMLALDNDHRFSIIQGPPGSGKTAVIAAFTASSVAAGRSGIWLIAQSNVAVKNIAEKLHKINFEPYKLLVSQDFYAGWHDHLYHSISRKVIPSCRFKEYGKDTKELDGCKVILCTLSMLSNPLLSKFTSKIPINFLVVDEASQINISDYINPLNSFRRIQKLCFIGDDKQLPPHGQEEIEEIQSIFEIPHLRQDVLLLNIQYRMPRQIGEFISEKVYDGQLGSNPEHFKGDEDTCFFIDVTGSKESVNGTSYQNTKEATTVITMATHLQEEGVNFKIITPYDAQRNLIENGLKNKGLVWQDKCFNVDSFQGNEEDIIILSLVRTDDLGFLKDKRRTNVMLTRCKDTLYICSSWEFLVCGPGRNSLVGEMATYMEEKSWISLQDIEEGNF